MNIYVEDNSKNMQDESFQKNYKVVTLRFLYTTILDNSQ